MAILLEGRLEFAWRNGLVHVSDESGARLSISLPDFYVALADAASECCAMLRLSTSIRPRSDRASIAARQNPRS
jgi:hypothetical protein